MLGNVFFFVIAHMYQTDGVASLGLVSSPFKISCFPRMCACAYVCARARVCARACVCVRAYACTRVCVNVGVCVSLF